MPVIRAACSRELHGAPKSSPHNVLTSSPRCTFLLVPGVPLRLPLQVKHAGAGSVDVAHGALLEQGIEDELHVQK